MMACAAVNCGCLFQEEEVQRFCICVQGLAGKEDGARLLQWSSINQRGSYFP